MTDSTSGDPVLELERDDRLVEAAELAESSNRYADAVRLWERAVRFSRAAKAALAAGNPVRALLLAARTTDPAVERSVIESLASGEPTVAARAADEARGNGYFAAAARLRLACGDALGAGADFERGARLLDAASAFSRGGEPRSAARCLEAALAREPDLHVARVRLGSLLLEHGRTDAAARTLQAVPKTAPERAAALGLLRRALEALALDDAAREVEAELTLLGVEDAPTIDVRGEETATEHGGTVGQVIFGRYEVLAHVAATPTGRVLRARDRVTGETVAVKIFSAASLRDAGRDALARFRREAEVLGRLRHPSIVPLREYVPTGPAVVLAWMEGGSLADVLAESTVSPARAVEIATAVLSALGEAHRRGILHRDIKPANVLFDAAGAACLADFGTAHVSDAGATVTAGILGTLAYMAPEQRSGAAATIQSDVYGVGALLWHALTGGPPGSELPFLSDELEDRHREVARRMIGEPAERPPSTTEAIELLRSCDWPVEPPRARAPRALSTRPPPPNERLEPLDGPLHRDTLLDRHVYVLPAEPAVMERALPFARADHPQLPAVLVLKTDDGTVWIDAPSERALSRPATAAEIAELEAALRVLHDAGGYHGAVDRAHVVERGGELTLCFPLEPTTRTWEDDLASLQELGNPSP